MILARLAPDASPRRLRGVNFAALASDDSRYAGRMFQRRRTIISPLDGRPLSGFIYAAAVYS